MPQLNLISHPTTFEGEVKAITSILAHCDMVFHLRKPELDNKAYEALVKELPEAYYHKVVLHSAYHLAEAYEFAGLHFSTAKREVANKVNINIEESTSCHSFEEVSDLNSGFNSCFLSPVYSSISKPSYKGDFNHDELKQFLALPREIKIVALGGVDASNAQATLNMGFDGVAVLGAVWGGDPQPDDDFLIRVKRIEESLDKPFCLSIAGFDPSAGAGVLSDIKTFEANGVYGLGVNTANTFQNDETFDGVEWVDVKSIKAQLKPLAKYDVKVVKIGLVENIGVLKEILRYVKSLFPTSTVIWDPILKASAGFEFHTGGCMNAEVFEYVDLITPNAEEYEHLQLKYRKKVVSILLKGGHRMDKKGVDTLFYQDEEIDIEGIEMLNKIDKHGTGCVLSSAIAANMAKGDILLAAAKKGKRYVEQFIMSNKSSLGWH